MVCVEFPQVQHIDLSETVHVLKSFAIVTCELLNLSTTELRCPSNRGLTSTER